MNSQGRNHSCTGSRCVSALWQWSPPTSCPLLIFLPHLQSLKSVIELEMEQNIGVTILLALFSCKCRKNHFLCVLTSILHSLQVAPKSITTQPISDADIEATCNQAGEIARSIASASTSVLPPSSVDEATNQEVLQFFNLLEMPFEELATSRSSELLSCMTKIQTIAATVFTEDQQKQLNEMADQLQSKVDGVHLYHDEIKAKNDYIASIGGISSSILSNNGKETELKQEDQQLATEEQELREKLERVIKQRLDIRREREKLYAETKDLWAEGRMVTARFGLPRMSWVRLNLSWNLWQMNGTSSRLSSLGPKLHALFMLELSCWTNIWSSSLLECHVNIYNSWTMDLF